MVVTTAKCTHRKCGKLWELHVARFLRWWRRRRREKKSCASIFLQLFYTKFGNILLHWIHNRAVDSTPRNIIHGKENKKNQANDENLLKKRVQTAIFQQISRVFRSGQRYTLWHFFGCDHLLVRSFARLPSARCVNRGVQVMTASKMRTCLLFI